MTPIIFFLWLKSLRVAPVLSALMGFSRGIQIILGCFFIYFQGYSPLKMNDLRLRQLPDTRLNVSKSLDTRLILSCRRGRDFFSSWLVGWVNSCVCDDKESGLKYFCYTLCLLLCPNDFCFGTFILKSSGQIKAVVTFIFFIFYWIKFKTSSSSDIPQHHHHYTKSKYKHIYLSNILNCFLLRF